ncbi:MAG: DUF6650 family protein [Lachnospiraceae bacterium]|nr:DUF6650 family protein [Lachnospiraceae bacterium]
MQKRTFIFLESQRILYSEYEYETVYPCIMSVKEIKDFLTHELMDSEIGSNLSSYIRKMISACNRFLSRCPDNKIFKDQACFSGNIYNWIFISGIGEMRGVFGIMIGQISRAYGIDVDDNTLAKIIPLESENL